MALVQRPFGAVGVLMELMEVSDHILSNNVTFEARPLCNLMRCTASWKSNILMKL